MPLPEVGERVPDFALADVNGHTYPLSESAQGRATLAVFFKRSCVTSRLALPFVERLHRLYPALRLIGVSQDDAADTEAFSAQAGLTFPVVLDSDWKVSTEYDLFTVPTAFLLDKAGRLARVNMGWSTEQYNALSAEVARLLEVTLLTLVTAEDKVPVFKPG
ncbi:MAG: TlpA family protein disulfide reductase [Chloroflexi bacterium]|nr:TlpA family protein disulfide reductase [Chloroflexota bacterium]MBI3733467.1 TlpA family protein disulfide reductase [Chloroflexota bacterium]